MTIDNYSDYKTKNNAGRSNRFKYMKTTAFSIYDFTTSFLRQLANQHLSQKL